MLPHDIKSPVSKTAVWNWERDLSIPRPATLAKLAAGLGVEEQHFYASADASFAHRHAVKAVNGRHSDLTKAVANQTVAAVSLGAVPNEPNESGNGSIAKLLQETRTRIAEIIGVDSGRVKLHIEFWSD